MSRSGAGSPGARGSVGAYWWECVASKLIASPSPRTQEAPSTVIVTEPRRQFAKYVAADGILYPYQKSGAIVNCPDGTNVKASTGGAPFTIDTGDVPLGYDKNSLLVTYETGPDGTEYGPYRNATEWDNVAESILLADSSFGPSNTRPAQSSFNGLYLPKDPQTGAAQSCLSANLAGRHGKFANVAMQDTHAKGFKTYTPPAATSYGDLYDCPKTGTGFLLGPGVTIVKGMPAPAGTNYYYVPDKSLTNPIN